MPAASFTSREIVAVYCVLPVRFTVGVNVAVLPLSVMVPATAAPCAVVSVKLLPFALAAVSGSEKVAETVVLSATADAALAGETDVMLGGVGSSGENVGSVPVPGAPQEDTNADATASRRRRNR